MASAHSSGADQAVAGAGRVALVEDEVDDGEDAGQAVGDLGVAGDAIGDPRRRDLALGAHQPLGHRRLRHEEGARDLPRGQPAEGPQGQRDAGVHRQRRVTAGEDQAQAVVVEGRLVLGLRGLVVAVELHERVQGRAGGRGRRFAAQAINRLAPRRGGDPEPRVRGLAVARPGGQRDGETRPERVLGQLEVAAQVADQRGEDAAGLLAKGALDRAAHIAGTCISGRTSTWP
jgi:hypothetical protein